MIVGHGRVGVHRWLNCAGVPLAAPEPDLPLVLDTLRALGQKTCPDLASVKDAGQRWASYLDDPADAALFAGDALLHTDYNPDNLLIADGRAYLIDWAWPTRGAAWIDPCCLLVRRARRA